MSSGILVATLHELLGNLCRAVAVHTKVKRLTHHLCCLAIYDPVCFVIGVLDIAVGRIRTERFAVLPFRLEHSANFLARVLGVPFVGQFLIRKGAF